MPEKNAADFSYASLKFQLESALEQSYQFLSCKEYVLRKKSKSLSSHTIVNRVDIDLSCKKVEKLADIFIDLGLQATFFVRLHAPEYNPFDFENYRILKHVRDSGFEIAYHSEIVDQATIWGEPAVDCLLRDIAVLNCMLDIKVSGGRKSRRPDRS